ncbi:hypothetical protein OG225_19980 [Nocardia sp. NBC_01377]|uniref:hypothetical protein n=1 Tax=Nocardia sp. NBC_01377 TaxID=2903595 RepID=UPI0032548AED
MGLPAVLSARRLGAEQIVLTGRHRDRTALEREFGALFGRYLTLSGGPAPVRAYIDELLGRMSLSAFTIHGCPFPVTP